MKWKRNRLPVSAPVEDITILKTRKAGQTQSHWLFLDSSENWSHKSDYHPEF